MNECALLTMFAVQETTATSNSRHSVRLGTGTQDQPLQTDGSVCASRGQMSKLRSLLVSALDMVLQIQATIQFALRNNAFNHALTN